MSPVPLTVTLVPLDHPHAQALIAALNAELTARYPEEGATHFSLAASEVMPGQGAFVVAYFDEDPVACGAIRRLDAERAELERMYVDKNARGLGIGRKILEALECEARGLGVTRVVLETGTRQAEAMALYQSHGYAPIECYGEYARSPLSACFAKTL